MASELGAIGFYLAKEGKTFNEVIRQGVRKDDSQYFKTRDFTIDTISMRFICEQKNYRIRENPPWLDFVNQQLEEDAQVHFETHNKRPSGLLLIDIDSRVLAATFGMRGRALMDKSHFLTDFGIKAAMNLCGNQELRQTKSRTHAITTQHIDRQLSRPSDAFSFGLNETELLQYISAQLADDKSVTLQGKDNLTIKVIGEEKLSWENLLEYGQRFIQAYHQDHYKTLFPNYPNFQDIPKEKISELDAQLVEKIQRGEFEKMHLCIPEFIPDDQYSFSYTCSTTKENRIYSHIDINHLSREAGLRLEQLTADALKRKNVYAYSAELNQVLHYPKWALYQCLVVEIEWEGDCYILSEGLWRQVDDDFYQSVNTFIDEVLEVQELPEHYHHIDIAHREEQQNREAIFNQAYCELNANAILFDRAKLRIGQGRKDKEFCDIFERCDHGPAHIIHVKKYGGGSSLNYLFSQARFYSEFFLRDQVFQAEIRQHIENSDHPDKHLFMDYIKDNPSDINGRDYRVGLWILYNSIDGVPEVNSLPLMAKHEIKQTYEQLRNIHKYHQVSLSMVPVAMINFTQSKKPITQ